MAKSDKTITSPAKNSKTKGNSTKTTGTSSSGKRKNSRKASTASGKKAKRPLWQIILIILVAAFLVWFFLFDGKVKVDSFLETNFGTTTDQIFQTENSSASQTQSTETSTSETTVTPSPSPVTGTSVTKNNDSYATKQIELPICKASATGSAEDHEIHSYNGFQLCYRESYEVAEWVAYVLTREELNAVTGRSNKFHADKLISSGSATPSDYTNSGYDRGHLAPAADLEWSVASMEDSFLMSNMTPQAPDFNRGRWKDLEDEVRKWADRFGEVTVVTGPILEKPAENYSKIGKNEVSVPEYFYKALLAESNGKKVGIGFILPNQKCEGSIWTYAVSIDEVERRTGLDFFSALNDSIEEQIESSTDFSYWK